MSEPCIHLADGWRLADDGERQWIVQRWQSPRWRDQSFCGTRDGLIDVAIPHNGIPVADVVLARLRCLPKLYKRGALAGLVTVPLRSARNMVSSGKLVSTSTKRPANADRALDHLEGAA